MPPHILEDSPSRNFMNFFLLLAFKRHCTLPIQQLAKTPRARYRAASGNQGFSHYVIHAACDVLLKTSFVGEEINYFSNAKDPFEILNTCLQNHHQGDQNNLYQNAPQSMKLELMTTEILCKKCMCVSGITIAPIGNLQTIKHLHNIIPFMRQAFPCSYYK